MAALAAVAAADTPLENLLKDVEHRYNRARTLEILFNEAYTGAGQPRRTEAGQLLLRKPGLMRWNYSQPRGKLFVSDGKWLWLYTPANNRVEKMKLKESEDMRAPLAFLLGKLDFSKEFKEITSRSEGGLTIITAKPKTDTLPYTSVEFAVTPDRQIRRVKVTGYDKSVLDFTFTGEKLNPPLESAVFKFKTPPGAEVVTEASR
ncbi:MAG: outer membrane lipoprotein carrier protein LolA [Acidobacteria bacterium]|nr:outer membrane lipoprotein carrier protein LolA [Acidobacteriota bacterium]